MARILIIDDNETMREGLAATVRRMGHEAMVARRELTGWSNSAGAARFRHDRPENEGRAASRWSKACARSIPPARDVVTALALSRPRRGDAPGAFDFLQKPSPRVVRLKVNGLELGKERQARERAEANRRPARRCRRALWFTEIVGETTSIRAVFQIIEKVAPPTPPFTSTANRAPAKSWWRAPSIALAAPKGRSSR